MAAAGIITLSLPSPPPSRLPVPLFVYLHYFLGFIINIPFLPLLEAQLRVLLFFSRS
ncbi:hypothetical protein CGRA01v4_06172 [Colletotrichum graminicola]|nr:hypothetical protein CGRA01v4_06172 [Colletotrichum graminicola]